jgi:hypothetical protein
MQLEGESSVSRFGKEFQEIGHCGGHLVVNMKTMDDGQRGIQFGFRHSRPTPASVFGIYALPQGFPVGNMDFGGMDDGSNSLPTRDCLPVFIASDSLGMFGHQCPRCKEYWRSTGAPSKWKMTCPYCGLRNETYYFRTDGQRRYINAFCEFVAQAMQSEEDGEHIVDMDKVADAVGKEGEKPKFYYAEESQQNKYKCAYCDALNDILGRYGYCAVCGTHNGLTELEGEIVGVRKRINEGQPCEACLKDAISSFDSYARQIAKQLAIRIPMTPDRKKEWKKKLFHNLKACAEALRTAFDIDMLKQLDQDNIDFAALMFCRRHVYEHNGGEVDERYIRKSGDASVRPKQVIRESRETVLRTADLVMKMGRNIHDGFHETFAPEEMPLKIARRR